MTSSTLYSSGAGAGADRRTTVAHSASLCALLWASAALLALHLAAAAIAAVAAPKLYHSARYVQSSPVVHEKDVGKNI